MLLGNSKKSAITWWVLLASLLISRFWSTIYYIEDLDSLRFALSMIDYNVVKNQPHFPAYPVFCFLTKLVYMLVGHYTVAFSVIGSLSTFGVIFFLLRSAKIQSASFVGILVIFLLAFNPLLWLMSNRYMPDMMGVAFMISSFYYFQSNDKTPTYKAEIGFFLTGILLGVRLSYIPFLFPLIIINLFDVKKTILKRCWLVASGLFGFFIWLIPLVLITGWSELIEAAKTQSQGHFTDFGGTITTEPNYVHRLAKLIESIWADGFGFYWRGRNLVTVISTLSLSSLVCFTFIKSGIKKTIKVSYFSKIALLSCIIYLIWIFYCQNVVHKSRHVLPLLPFITIVMAKSLIQLIQNSSSIWSHFLVKGMLIIGLLGYSMVSLYLVNQHKKPTAIAQIHEYLKQIDNNYNKSIQIISVPLIQYYLVTQDFKANYLVVEQKEPFDLTNQLDQGADWIAIGSPLPFQVTGKRRTLRKNFYHNPYVNRMWPSLTVYKYPAK